MKEQEILKSRKKITLPSKMMMSTSMGDIFIELYPDLVPKTVENFVTHARNNYYNHLLFHRVIKDFMVQTGCPKGDGTGGKTLKSSFQASPSGAASSRTNFTPPCATTSHSSCLWRTQAKTRMAPSFSSPRCRARGWTTSTRCLGRSIRGRMWCVKSRMCRLMTRGMIVR